MTMPAIAFSAQRVANLSDEQLKNASVKKPSPFKDDVVATIKEVTAGFALFRDRKTGLATKSQYVTVYVVLDIPHVVSAEEAQLIADWNSAHPDDKIEAPQFEAITNAHCNINRKYNEVDRNGNFVAQRTASGDAWSAFAEAYNKTNALDIRNAVRDVAVVGKKVVFHHDQILQLVDGVPTFKPVLGFKWA